jgi:peptide/nickel transport system substrate-binding protein
MNRFKPVFVAALLAGLTALAACGGGSGGGNASTTSGTSGEKAPPPKAGGQITVLEDSGFAGSWPAGLDPATNTNGAANQPFMDTIYGQLFKLVEGGKVVGELAQSGTVSPDGKTFTIKLRPGVKFTDGSPFDAATVKWNFDRSLASPCTCNPKSFWPKLENPWVTTSGSDTVKIHFTAPFAAINRSFISANVNWIASKTSFEKMGEKAFKQKPVGAGPFTVVSNSPSNQLVVKKNPGYFRTGHPYLDQITFKSIGGDQAAYQALQAGQADAYEGISTPALTDQASKQPSLTVTQMLSTSPYVIQLNTETPPFNDKKARDAVYYATDTEAIRKGLFNNRYPTVQSFTGPGGLFFKPTVPGYKTYDLQKAKQIVQQLGGLNVTLGTINVLVAKQTTEALQSQWAKAGIKTKIESYDLAGLIKAFGGKWQAMLQTAGAWDPAIGVGVAFRFNSHSPFTGVKDPKLDKLLSDASGTLDEAKREQLYDEAGKLISDQSYAPFMFAFAPANIARKGVYGPGLTTRLPAVAVNPPVSWPDVYTTGGSGSGT